MLYHVQAVKSLQTMDGLVYAYAVVNEDNVTAVYSVSKLRYLMKYSSTMVKNLHLVSDEVVPKEGCSDGIEVVKREGYYLPQALPLWEFVPDTPDFSEIRNVKFVPYASEQEFDQIRKTLIMKCGLLGQSYSHEEVNPGLHIVVKPTENAGENDLLIYFCGTTLYLHWDCSYMFAELNITGKIDFSGVDASYARDISYMFYDASVGEVDLKQAGFSKIRHMYRAFNVRYADSINLKGVDTSAVIEPSELCILSRWCLHPEGENLVKTDDTRIRELEDEPYWCVCDCIGLNERKKPAYYLVNGYASASLGPRGNQLTPFEFWDRVKHREIANYRMALVPVIDKFASKHWWYIPEDHQPDPEKEPISELDFLFSQLIQEEGFDISQKHLPVPAKDTPAAMKLLPAKVVLKREQGKCLLGIKDYFSRKNDSEEIAEYLDLGAFFSGVDRLVFLGGKCTAVLRHRLIYDTGMNRRTRLPWNPTKWDLFFKIYDYNKCVKMKDLGKDAVAFVIKDGEEDNVYTGYIAAKASNFIMTPAVEKRIKNTLQLEEIEGGVTVLRR